MKIKRILLLSIPILAIVALSIIFLPDYLAPKHNLTAQKAIGKLNESGLNLGSVVVYNEKTDPNGLMGKWGEYTSKARFLDIDVIQGYQEYLKNDMEKLKNLKNSEEYKKMPPPPKTNNVSDILGYDFKYPVYEHLKNCEYAVSYDKDQIEYYKNTWGSVEVFRNSKDCLSRKNQLQKLKYPDGKPTILVSENVLLKLDYGFKNIDEYINAFNKVFNGVS